MGRTARLLFAALGLLAVATLALQLSLNIERWDGVGPALWKMARYFTLWTAALVAVASLFAASTAELSDAQAGMVAATVLFAAVVGVVYHVLLSPTHHPKGLWALTNVILHYVLPTGVALLWLFATPKGRLFWRAPVVWLSFPLLYIVATVTRGAYYQEYPYFFLDIGRHGVSTVGVNSAALCAAFVLGGLVMVLADRMMAGARASARGADA